MNKKIYLLSFAAAAMFASCSNEMEEFKTNSDQGFKVNIQIAKDASETRLAASEDGTKYTWELGDKFSLFNVGTTVPVGAFTASANAAYKTTDGENFASENVLFNGYHALVFPINYNYVTAGTKIEVAPITDGSEKLGNRSVILGKNVVEITADGLKDDKGNKLGLNQSGYNKNIKMGARVASTAFVFNLKSDKPLALTENDPVMKVNKVELISTGKAFATKANLTAGSKGEIIAAPVDSTTTATVEYKDLTFNAAGTKAIIVALPNTVATTGTAQLKLYTNYGIVTIADAAQVSQVKEGKTLIQLANPAEKAKDYKATPMSFNSEVKVLAEKAAAGAAVPNVLRDVQVDFSQTDINGMVIKNSADLIAAYRAYDLLEKSYAKFTLQGESFELTKDAVKAINDHKLNETKDKGVELTCKATTITLSGFGADYVTIPVIDQISKKTLVLAADSKWTIDVQNASTANAFDAIVNKGTLKITEGTKAEGEQALGIAIENDGTIEFGGDVNMPKAINDNMKINDKGDMIAGTINVADGQTVNLKGGADIAVGTINVGSTANSTAILASSNENDKIVKLGADVTTNVYGSLLNAKGAELHNAGVINIKDANAGVIITTNSGTINATAKDNYVTVGTQNGYTKLVVTDAKFEVKTANMGIANYIVFKGSELNIAESNFYVELCETAKVTESVKDAATVKEFNVAKGKMITIPAGSYIVATKTNNQGTIRVYGEFKSDDVTAGESNIYRY